MSRNTLAVLLVIIFAFSLTASAQTLTPEPAAWPPDPNEIFAEGVSWSLFDESLDKSLMIDNQQRVIRVQAGETEVWHEYSFPEGKEIQKAEIQPDGRIRVSWSYEDTYSLESTLLLNPNTGLYQEPDTVCEGKALKAPSDQGQWLMAYHDVIGDEPFLCHSATGEQREDLPVGFMNWYVFATPNNKQLIIAAGDIYEYQVYVYHLSDGSLMSLGIINGYHATLSICDWLTDTRGLLCSTSREDDDLPTTYYEFDITQEETINEVFYAWPDNIFTLEDPKRYFVIDDQGYDRLKWGGSSGNEPFRPCKLLIYDATGLREEVLGNRCIPGIDYVMDQTASYFFFGGPYFYYLIKENEWAAVSTLYKYDSRQEMRSEALFTGEIDRILSASPDNRYIVVILSHGGFFECCIKPQQVGILDTQTGKIIYRSELIGVYMSNQIIWLDDRTLVIVAGGALENMGISAENGEHIWREIPATLRRIELQEEKAVTTQITADYGFSVSFDFLNVRGDYWLKLEENILIDLNTFETVPLVREDILPQYYVSAQWNWEKPYGVKVNISLRDDNVPRRRVSYVVPIPE